MAKIKGEECTPVLANASQTKVIQELFDISVEFKRICNRRDQLLGMLEKEQDPAVPFSAKIRVISEEDPQGEFEYMTVAVGEPDGHFVVYRKLDLVHKAKTTKKDMAFLGVEND